MLDRTWGRLLGARRSGGIYRLPRWQFSQRLARLGPGQLAAGAASPHTVVFYDTADYLVYSVGRFLETGLRAGSTSVVIATETHRHFLRRRLGAAGIDIAAALRDGRQVELDAAETVAGLLVDGMPDRARMLSRIELIMSGAGRGRGDTRVYGEMVAVLCQEGNDAAAVALEEMWNELISRHSLSLLCAYPMSIFDTSSNVEGFRRICQRHSRVIQENQRFA